VNEVSAVVNTPQGQQVLRFFVTADNEHAIMGEMMPFGADPFLKDREILKKEAFGATKGPADAAMQIVEFADLECPACKQALPAIDRLQQDFPNVKFVFQSFPLESLHPWATTAAKYLDCIARQSNDAGWNFVEAVYSHQGEITAENLKEKLGTYVGLANQDPAKIAACADAPETAARIQQSIALGNKVTVTQTPTFFINGRGVAGINPQEYDQLKQVVQYELTQATSAK
jgi:protein-disulfide isomerase